MTYTIRVSNKSVDPSSTSLNTLYFENISPALISDITTTYENFIQDMTITDNSIYVPLYNRDQVVKVPPNSVLIITTDNTDEAIYYRSLTIKNSSILINPDPVNDTSSATLIEKTITENGTYYATDDGADGYSVVDVDVAGGSLEDADVRFFDYDGTVVYGYTKEQFLALTEMPPNPAHEGLTAQGWNWTFEGAHDYVEHLGGLDIGQSYITNDGKTRYRIYISQADVEQLELLDVIFVQDGQVEVDWGDGSEIETISGLATEEKSFRHTFHSIGYYTVSINVVSGIIELDTLNNSSENPLLVAVEIGLGVSFTGEQWELRLAYEQERLKYITIPTYITHIGALYQCNSLKCAILPMNSVLGSSVFRNCSNLKTFCLPETVTVPSEFWSIGSQCGSVERLYIPSGVTTMKGEICDYCYSLKTVCIPNSVTEITDYGDYILGGCYNVSDIIIDNTENAIEGSPWGADLYSDVTVTWLRSE